MLFAHKIMPRSPKDSVRRRLMRAAKNNDAVLAERLLVSAVFEQDRDMEFAALLACCAIRKGARIGCKDLMVLGGLILQEGLAKGDAWCIRAAKMFNSSLRGECGTCRRGLARYCMCAHCNGTFYCSDPCLRAGYVSHNLWCSARKACIDEAVRAKVELMALEAELAHGEGTEAELAEIGELAHGLKCLAENDWRSLLVEMSTYLGQ